MRLDYQEAMNIIGENDLNAYQAEIDRVHKCLHERTGLGAEFTGWLDLPSGYDRDELQRLEEAAAKIREQAEVFLVIGIGGSYIGARAGIEMLCSSFYNQVPHDKRPAVYFAGNNLSPDYLNSLLEIIGEKDIALNVISKSGTTLEPAIAFRVFRSLLEKRYGKEEAGKRIYVTTDKAKGALKTLADREGYTSFVIPDDIGGRFSVLTPVGLLPLAVAGLQVREIMAGAFAAEQEYADPDLHNNICYQYALLRRLMNNKGKGVELLAAYEPDLLSFCEWWKQLFGESEGKNGKGLFPASVSFSTDLHSLGQFIQDGSKILFETVLKVEKNRQDFQLFSDEDNLDGLNYLADKKLSEINEKACLGTLAAHEAGKVPNLVLHIEELSEYYFGKLVYFFEKACAVSSYLLGVNPFDQPGVEHYKKNMFSLLGKK